MSIQGAKFKSKAKVINKFLEIADQVLIGGKIGFDLKLKSEKQVAKTRIYLSKSVMIVIKNGLGLLGIETLKKM